MLFFFYSVKFLTLLVAIHELGRKCNSVHPLSRNLIKFGIRSTTFYDHRINLLVNKQIFLDSSVEHWNDKRGGTGMTGGGPLS
ncbi:MAG: hypothetical protein ACR5K9_02115 [Wolbachia sp.]